MRAWGTSDQPPTVILHGYLEQCAAWDTVAQQMTGQVITYDHRGHGLSEHVGAGGFYHFFDYVSDLEGVIRSLDCDSIHLVGHSMGGTIACLYAALHPERVRSLVLIEGLGPPDSTQQALQQGRTYLRHRISPPTHRPMKNVDEGVARMRRTIPNLEQTTAEMLVTRGTVPAAKGQLQWRWDSRHRSRSPRPFDAKLFRTYLSAISAPSLLVFGTQSPYLAIPDLSERIAALPHATRVDIPDVGHHPHHQCPTQLATLINQHIQEESDGRSRHI